MAWEIGDEGFNIVLSTYVPQILGANLPDILVRTLERRGFKLEDIDAWAVHPGGRLILDKVESALDLDSDALASSRKILRHFGNMSSATILFVLKDMMTQGVSETRRTCAMAFGPGLTVETALLQRCGASQLVSMDADNRKPGLMREALAA
jgi:predicted naringenin-chalcone synthase